MILFAILIAVCILWFVGGRLSTRTRRNLVLGYMAIALCWAFFQSQQINKQIACKTAIIKVTEAEKTSEFMNFKTFDKADINKDGCVDSEDILFVKKKYSIDFGTMEMKSRIDKINNTLRKHNEYYFREIDGRIVKKSRNLLP